MDRQAKKTSTVSLFSFFTGAGFLDLGFEDAGFEEVFANELIDDFATVYTYSRAQMKRDMLKYGLQRKSIDCFLEHDEDKLYLHNSMKYEWDAGKLVGFLGGPPCPDFSVAGKNKGAEGEHGRLSMSYAKLIVESSPDFFVFENVKGLWRTVRHREFFDSLVSMFQYAGYATTVRLINALEYGAPQDRDRIILIGVKRTLLDLPKDSKKITDFPWMAYVKYPLDKVKKAPWPKTSPFKAHSQSLPPDDIIEELTVEHWFKKNDVEHHPNASDYFIPRAGLTKMERFDEGDDSKKCYKRLHRWRYSPTAAYGNNEVHLHPYLARRLSVAETLAIQSLPANYVMPPNVSLTAKFKTIGNGVPYLAALGVGNTLMTFLKQEVMK